MAELKNPALAGTVLFDTVIYASAGSNYGGVPESRLKRYLQWRLSEVVFNRLGYMSRFPA